MAPRSLAKSALFATLFAVTSAQYDTPSDGFEFIDPLIGTVNGGHVFPGATLPYSMAKSVADVTEETQGGYASNDSPINGWSHMHDSGTGGGSSFGNFPLFPQSTCPEDDVEQCKFDKLSRRTLRKKDSAKAYPGYFTVSLENGIEGETTVSNRTAIYRFTFPEPASNETLSPLMLLDLTDLGESRRGGGVTVDLDTGRITGAGEFTPSFGQGSYKLYSCADFTGAKIRYAGTFKQGEVKVNNTALVAPPNPAGGFVRFEKPEKDNAILARVGLSFISTEQACQNAEREIPEFDFDGTLKVAEDAWHDKLSVFKVDATGVPENYQRTFWSGYYRVLISPQDYTGENPLWESDEPYFDSYYCIWDSYRTVHPLLTIVDPAAQTLMVRSMIDIYRNEGFLPDCRMSLCKGFTQGGSNADPLLVDSYLKGIKDGVDWDTGYEALLTDAEKTPPDFAVEGRGNLESWRSNHYIPTNDPVRDPGSTGPFTRSISRTVEYAYNDFCIATMAQKLGKTDDYEKYLERSGWWKNMFKEDQTSNIAGNDTGFVGFLQPKYKNFTWGFQDPIFCSPLLNFDSCYLNPSGHETYEGSCWLYSFFAPGDHETLIRSLGGPETFVKRLDFFHDSGLAYIGNEVAFLTVFQYNYAGRPARSAHRSHFYIPSQFNDTVVGIPGNDDSGAMGAFTVLTMMGFSPNPGQDVYLISTPFFPEVSVTNPATGKTATIRSKNFDLGKNIYVQSATLDGEPYSNNWFTHSFFLDGGVFEFEMGPEESDWGTKDEDLPPSLGPFTEQMLTDRQSRGTVKQ